MNDERFLKEWLEDDAPDSPGTRESAHQIMARLPKTSQRSRWWPLLRSGRSTSKPSQDGEPPTLSGRTRFMFSPAKAITAAVFVFAVGGALFIAQPNDRQGANVPGAETGTSAVRDPAPFSGEIHAYGGSTIGGYRWTVEEMTDPRLDGTAFYSGSGADLTHDSWIGWWTLRIVNERGAWQASFPAFYWDATGTEEEGNEEAEGPDVATALLYGEGDYEGLVAVMGIDLTQPYGWGVNGVVVDAETLPEPPAPAGVRTPNG